VYILANEPTTNKLVIMGFNTEEQDIDGLDSISYINDEVQDLLVSVAGRHNNDYMMVYDRK
jgi:hypothetical protein